MKTIKKFISDVLLEIALDSRIGDGIVNLTNYEHTQVLAENLFDRGIDLQLVVEVVNSIVAKEGKYPERQAYNKEGWLVTFPSTEYKNNAIKKGTHHNSDPTHGKGGMNIYYKRRGKQKRVAQQGATEVEPTQSAPTQAPTGPSAVPPTNPAPAPATAAATPPPDKTSNTGDGSSLPPISGAENPTTPNKSTKEPTAKDTDSAVDSPSADSKPQSDPSSPTPQSPAPAPVASTVASTVGISIEFAKNKQWNPTPYGEWRGLMGDTMAVVGLSGEVVPIKANDREELKLFVSKKQLR